MMAKPIRSALVAIGLSLTLSACGDRADAAERVAASCAAVEQSLRHRARSFEDDPESFLLSVRVEGHGTAPQLRHVILCARVLEPSEGAFDSLVQEYTVAADEAHGLLSQPDPPPPAEQTEPWRALLTRMASIVGRINAPR